MDADRLTNIATVVFGERGRNVYDYKQILSQAVAAGQTSKTFVSWLISQGGSDAVRRGATRTVRIKEVKMPAAQRAMALEEAKRQALSVTRVEGFDRNVSGITFTLGLIRNDPETGLRPIGEVRDQELIDNALLFWAASRQGGSADPK